MAETDKKFGIIVFKNYRWNKDVQISFCNSLSGKCYICLENNILLTHFQECGHLICVQCSKMISKECSFCKSDNLIYSKDEKNTT